MFVSNTLCSLCSAACRKPVRKLVQGIVNSTERHLAAIVYFADRYPGTWQCRPSSSKAERQTLCRPEARSRATRSQSDPDGDDLATSYSDKKMIGCVHPSISPWRNRPFRAFLWVRSDAAPAAPDSGSHKEHPKELQEDDMSPMQQNAFSYDDLIRCAKAKCSGGNPAAAATHVDVRSYRHIPDTGGPHEG